MPGTPASEVGGESVTTLPPWPHYILHENACENLQFEVDSISIANESLIMDLITKYKGQCVCDSLSQEHDKQFIWFPWFRNLPSQTKMVLIKKHRRMRFFVNSPKCAHCDSCVQPNVNNFVFIHLFSLRLYQRKKIVHKNVPNIIKAHIKSRSSFLRNYMKCRILKLS